MKSFVVTLILFAMSVGAIIGNAFYIGHIGAELDTRIEALPDIGAEGCAAAANEIRDYWEKNSAAVGLSVSYTVTDRISEQTASLAACAACGDFYGYRTALALLRDAIGDMRRLEKLSVENLL